MEERKISKGEILQIPGEYNPWVYKVISGLLRSYTIDENGKEHIYMFAPKNWLIGDGYHEKEKNQLYIEAIEDSIIVLISKKDAALLDAPKLLKRMNVLQNRIIMLMSASAVERYKHFLKTYPDIIQRVPQKMIASYIGIKPEALSTVKSKYLKTETK